jgi:hypothetical protein
MRSSIVFYLMALRAIKPNWHRTEKLTRVIGWFFKVRKLARAEYPELDYKRVYIPKPGGKLRPLGVPTTPWRIYLHMLNQFIVLRWDKHIPLNQHGYRPGMGTLTLWREVLEKVIHAKDILEFDLRQCFPSINIYYGYSLFDYLGLPKFLNRKLFIINASRIRGKLLDHMFEHEQGIRSLILKGGAEELISRGIPRQRYAYIRGFAQGTPTSAFLSILCMVKPLMKRDIPKDIHTLLGADDGVYYGNICEGPREGLVPQRPALNEDGTPNSEEFSFIPLLTPNTEMTLSNLTFNTEKSGYVKAEGV